jgi:hypothetical protein
LLDLKFLDYEDNVYSIHDWQEHNGYAFFARERSLKAKKAAEARWHKENKNNNLMLNDACSNAMSITKQCPSPSPSPSPSPNNKERGEKSKIFSPPSLQEVKAYCHERNNRVSAEQWYDFYQAKNWMIGKNKMRDWKAAVRTWERRERDGQQKDDGWTGASDNIFCRCPTCGQETLKTNIIDGHCYRCAERGELPDGIKRLITNSKVSI